MSEFKKILDHPEKDEIISKLVKGESSKNVAQYLKIKYPDKDQAHLRLAGTLLKEFTEKYLDQYKFLNKVIKDEKEGKLDKKIADSLLNNKTWRERLAELADDEIDVKKYIIRVLKMIEARAEQVFDRIQQQPGNFKGDYVLINYFDKLIAAIEKADKIVNERPDIMVEHKQSVYIVEQYGVVFQEAIREVLLEMDPQFSARFMELLNEKLSKLKEKDIYPNAQSVEKRKESAEKLLNSVSSDDDEGYND